MYNVYIDDAYIKSSTGERIPLINALGAIIIDHNEEKKLIEVIKKEKSKYTHPNLPIKWNFKDSEIKRVFKEFKREEEHKKLLENSRDIRLNILNESLSIDYQIVFACIKSYSDNKKTITSIKQKFSQILFENILFRVGSEAKYKHDIYQIIMDWPTDNNPKPYNRAYYHIINCSKTITNNNNHCWPQSADYFRPSLYFCKCTHSPCLQFSDLIVGALKDYIEMSLKGNITSCIGKEAYNIFENKIRSGDNNKKLGYGIIAPSGNTDFKNKLTEIFDSIS